MSAADLDARRYARVQADLARVRNWRGFPDSLDIAARRGKLNDEQLQPCGVDVTGCGRLIVLREFDAATGICRSTCECGWVGEERAERCPHCSYYAAEWGSAQECGECAANDDGLCCECKGLGVVDALPLRTERALAEIKAVIS